MYERQFEAGVPFGPATERAKEIILEADKTLLRNIEAAGGFESYVEKHPELQEAFTTEKPFVCCMDERTARGTIHIPGSGILIEGEEAQAALRARLQESNVQGVYSHDKCGAAKLYGDAHGIADYDTAAIVYSKDLAEKLGVDYLGHLKTSGEHPGRAVYYDATEMLDKGSATWQEKMPSGFAVTRDVHSPEEAREAMIIAVKIAFSKHGYGPEFFSETDPLSLVYVASPEDDTTELQHELNLVQQQIIREIPEARGKIRIDGFTAPIEIPEETKLPLAA